MSARRSGGVRHRSEGVFWQVVIHLAFILSALALAWIDKLSTHYPSVEPSELPANVR